MSLDKIILCMLLPAQPRFQSTTEKASVSCHSALPVTTALNAKRSLAGDSSPRASSLATARRRRNGALFDALAIRLQCVLLKEQSVAKHEGLQCTYGIRLISPTSLLQMASRVKDIRKIGSVNKGLSLSRPKSSAGIIAPEFLLGTRGPVTVDENGAVSRKVAVNILTASFDGFSLSDLGQRIEEQRRELARERQQTFGGILSDVQGLSNNLLLERNKAEADRLRSLELEQRNKELEALLQALQHQMLQQQKQQQQESMRNELQKSNVTYHQPVVGQERPTGSRSSFSSSTSSSSSSSIGVQCSNSTTTSEVQTDNLEPSPACTDNFVWCKACEEKSSALESAAARLQHCTSQLSQLQSAVTDSQRREKEESNAKHALSLQVEQLQNLLLLESGRAAEIQNSSDSRLDSQLSAASKQLDDQKALHQQQLDAMQLHCREVELQLETVSKEQFVTRQSLEEALRESSAAAAIEQHVKSKLAAAQATISNQKAQLEQQSVAFAQERSEYERQLLQRDGAVQQAQAHAAELRQK
jgi:hypothetical protein